MALAAGSTRVLRSERGGARRLLPKEGLVGDATRVSDAGGLVGR